MNLLQDKNPFFETGKSDLAVSINNRNSSQSNQKPLSNNNNDILIVDYNDENNDATLYETPSHSFMQHSYSSEDSDSTPVARKPAPQPTAKTSLLTQGILDTSSVSQNDLTPTTEVKQKDDYLRRARNLERM